MKNINFLKYSKKAFLFSIALVLISLFFLFKNSLNFGLDFTGGTTIELQSADGDKLDEEKIRKVLVENNYVSAQVQTYGSQKDIQIKLPPKNGDVENEKVIAKEIERQLKEVQDILKENGFNLNFQGQSQVGPQVGKELVERGSQALIFSLLGIMLYISFRFQWKFSVGAVLALAHDLIITLGFFAITQVEFNLSVLAALLAVMGYSVNDTVVVFDRIRENFRLNHSGGERELTNLALNQTISRTIITSGTTILSVVALLLFGGPILYGFSLALIVGVLIGTYSSIFVAASTSLHLNISRDDMNSKKEELVDELP